MSAGRQATAVAARARKTAGIIRAGSGTAGQPDGNATDQSAGGGETEQAQHKFATRQLHAGILAYSGAVANGRLDHPTIPGAWQFR
jgi:hypothetical protein